MKRLTPVAILLMVVTTAPSWAQDLPWGNENDSVNWRSHKTHQLSYAEAEESQWHDQIEQTGWRQDVALKQDWDQQAESIENFQYTSGLLGRRILRFDASIWEENIGGAEFDGGAGEIQLSVPAPWTDFLFESVFHDLFLTSGGLEESTSYRVPGTTFTDKPILDGSQFAIGTTMFVSTIHGTRPFIQLGYRHEDYEINVERKDSSNGSQMSILVDDWSQDSFLANVGLEYDLHERVGFRGQLDFETKNGFSYSVWNTQLLLWPREYWFFNSGLWGPFNGDLVGFNLGAGVRF